MLHLLHLWTIKIDVSTLLSIFFRLYRFDI